MQLVLVHNIGHHDLYLTAGGDAVGRGISAMHRPNRARMREVSAAISAHLADGATARPWLDGRGVRVEPPLEVDLDGHPADGVFAPLLAAALDHVEALLRADPWTRLAVFLVSAGPTDAPNTPVGFGPMLAAIARERWAAAGLADRATATPVHLDGDAFALDAAELYFRLGEPIVALAAAVAERSPLDWTADFRVFLSASTGTAAMVAGLVAATTRWHPEVLAVPNARHEPRLEGGVLVGHAVAVRASNLVEGGALVHVDPARLDAAAALAWREMRVWRDEFRAKRPIRTEDAPSGDERHYWFRKGRREVLSVVVVKRDGGLRAIRGVNIEVSLPTGTLCAERNAISTALAEDPTLLRADIEAVAVLGLGSGLAFLGPCGTCQEWLRKVLAVNPRLRVLVFDGPEMGRTFLQPLPSPPPAAG